MQKFFVMCFREQQLDFLPFRAWIGLWTSLLLLLIVAFDLSALVRYITRFTEESFASLIAIIFIYEAFKKLWGKRVKFRVYIFVHRLYFKILMKEARDCDCNMSRILDQSRGKGSVIRTVSFIEVIVFQIECDTERPNGMQKRR